MIVSLFVPFAWAGGFFCVVVVPPVLSQNRASPFPPGYIHGP